MWRNLRFLAGVSVVVPLAGVALAGRYLAARG
jgi:hypothetical protein